MNFFSKIKEPVNGISHAVGELLSVAALVVLVCIAAKEATAWHVVSFAIYGTSLVALYTASSLYHSLKCSPKVESVLESLDHAMIYFLIAGTYTPLCLVALRGGWGWSLFGVNWALAVAGIVLKLTIRRPSRGVVVTLFTFYILMGWVIVIAWLPLARSMPGGGIFWLVLGGIFYTAGTFALNAKRFNFSPQFGGHELWHFFVLAGSSSHFWVMLKYVLKVG